MRAAVALTSQGRGFLLSRLDNQQSGLNWRVASGEGPFVLICDTGRHDGALLRRNGEIVIVSGSGSRDTTLFYYRCRNHVEIDTDLDRLVASTAASGLDRESLLHFVWRGRPIVGRTLYLGICQLRPGNELVCALSRSPTVRRVAWTLGEGFISADAEPRALITETLKRIRSAIAPMRTAKTAVLLSGGVDSSLLCALARKSGIEVSSYTVAFDPAYGVNETNYAQRVAAVLGIRHQIVPLKAAQALRLLDKVLESPLPRAVPAAITQAILMEHIAQDQQERVLSGLGADECFGGYHKSLEHLSALTHHLPRYQGNLERLYALPLSRLLRLRGALFFGIAEFFSLQELRKIAVDPGHLRRLVAPDLNFYRGALAFKADARPLELMAAHEYSFRLSELLLPALDTGPQTAVIEYPFLSPHVYLWASSLDPSLCYWHENGVWWAKRLLRAAASKLLPQDIVMRRRQVFLAPLAHWLLKKSWRARVSEEIADSAFWYLSVVNKRTREHLLRKLHRYRTVDVDPRWQEQLWVLLTLCAWINRHPASATRLPP